MKPYLYLVVLFAIAIGVNFVAPSILQHIGSLGGEAPIATTMFALSLIFGFGWACSKLAEGTIFPSFALQLLIGIILHQALLPLANMVGMIVVICTILAAIILKGGGDEVERRLFGKIALPTILIAVVGYLITFFVTGGLINALGLLDAKTAWLVAAIISSTDPAALIPTLKTVLFKSEHQKLVDISVAESALNDAVGAIFTGALIALIGSGASVESFGSLTHGLFSSHNLLHLGQQFLFGTVAGLVGWAIMYWYEKQKADSLETSYDFAIILAVPLITFFFAQMIHGNGFLAAFVAGLLANYNHANHNFHKTLHTMEVKIESLAKPTIFMMVGPLISPTDLFDTFGIGLAVAALFMFVARPLAVHISLLPTNITFNQKNFLCAVRETGVIPVVLAVMTIAQFPELKLLMPITAWVVIWTLIFLPAITPWWAKRLKLTQD